MTAIAATVTVVFPASAFAAGSSGKGTLTVSPAAVAAGTTLQPVFSFTSSNGASYGAGSSLSITVPTGWTAPSIDPANAGYTTATSGSGCTAGAVSVSGQVVTVLMTCSANGTLTVNYSANTTGAHASTTNLVGLYPFTATSKDGANAPLAISNPPAITVTAAAASKLAVTTQPSGGSAGTAWATQPAVTVQDAYGNPVTSSTASVALAITTGTGTAGATLACTTNQVAATFGLASFTSCGIDKVGTAYTLTATSTGLTNAVSTSFNITLGSAKKLAFTTSPSGGTGGVTFATQPVVTVQDAGGNTVTGDTSSVALAVTGGTGALTCTANPKAASSGVATFSGCAIDKAGTYTLTATDGTLTAATTSVTITVGPAVKLGFTTHPSASSTSGVAFATQPVVAAQDAGGNTVTTYSGSVTLTLSGSGPSGAALSCTANPRLASSGVAGFAGCVVDKSGSGYTLTPADGALTAVTSNAFSIAAGAAAKLVFSSQPSSSTGATAFTSQPVVTVQDANGNTVTADASSVTLTVTSGTGSSGAVLACTNNPKAASSGIATFTGCSIDKAGTGYTLTATDGSLTATSTTLAITVGPASKVALTTQPAAGSSVTAGSAFPVVATEQDAGGNTITSDSTTAVSLTLASGTGLSCPGAPTVLTSGAASFSCSLTLAATTYQLRAMAGSFTNPGNTFSVTPAAASKLTYTSQPAGATAGTALTAVSVAVQDTYGNTVTTGAGSTDTTVLTVASGPGAFTASSTSSVVAVTGVATFSNVTLTTAGAYTLGAADSTRTLTTTASASFTISPAAASKLSFLQRPSDAFAGAAMTPGVTVQVQDTYGNSAATNGVSVTLTPSVGVVDSGASATTNTSGLATFSAVLLNNTALGLTLTASATGYVATPASAAINITVKVTNAANALSDTASDGSTSPSGVATVTYYYCSGLTGTCTAGTPGRTQIASPVTSSTGTYTTAWTSQPANGPYRVVAVASDNAGNVTISTPTPVTIAN